MAKVSKLGLKSKSKKLVNKLAVLNHNGMSVCNGDYDNNCLPMLPPTSSDDSSCDELSPIEEEGHSSISTVSETSDSKYMSSFLGSSQSTISSDSEVSSYKNLSGEFVAAQDHEFCTHKNHTESDSSQETIGESCKTHVNYQKQETHCHDVANYNEDEQNNQEEIQQLQMSQNELITHQESKSDKFEVQQNQETLKEYHESTIIEINTESPFEAMLDGLTHQFGSQNDLNHTNNFEVTYSGNVNDLFTIIMHMSGLNRNKTFVFLMMNLSLVAANLNQAKYIIQSPDRSILFYISLGLLIAITFFQVLAKICSVFTCGSYDLDYLARAKRLDCLHKFTVFFTIIVALLNLGLTGITFAEFLKEIQF